VAAQDKLLGADERAVIRTRTHAKALIWPALLLIIIGAAAGAGAALVPRELRPAGQLAVAAIGLALAIWLVLLPFLRWWTTTYTITNRRLITRAGILNKIGKDLPLNRIHEVSYESSVIDRLLGCGTLYVQTAAEDGSMVLTDVPDVQRVHAEMTELLFGDHGVPGPDSPRP
jgi:uncharacterized membrane protein YdbT with pleckstrin-like domain